MLATGSREIGGPEHNLARLIDDGDGEELVGAVGVGDVAEGVGLGEGGDRQGCEGDGRGGDGVDRSARAVHGHGPWMVKNRHESQEGASSRSDDTPVGTGN